MTPSRSPRGAVTQKTLAAIVGGLSYNSQLEPFNLLK